MHGLDEPVRRYLTPALGGRGIGPTHVRLTMVGRTEVGGWLQLAFTAEQEFTAESIWMPGMLAPERVVSWRAEGDEVIVASLDVAPEHPDVRLRIDASGAVGSVSLMRWGNVGQEDFEYIPFGGDIHAERRFGTLLLPSEVIIGWWYGTPRYQPFFEATILDAAV